MKKALVLCFGLMVGVPSAKVYADNIKPGNEFLNCVYLVAWAAYETPGWIYDEVKRKLNRHNNLLAGAQQYLKNSYAGVWTMGSRSWCITIRDADQVIADFVAQEYAKSDQPDMQALWHAVSAQKNENGVFRAHESLKDIRTGLDNVIVALQKMLPHLWRSSIIEKYKECLAKARKQYVFVEKLLLLLEQSEEYKKQLQRRGE